MDHVEIYNNYWYGDWGGCVDGFIYTDNSGSSPGVRNMDVFNNVGIIVDTVVMTNGYIGLCGNLSPSGTQNIYNNTLIGNGQNDVTVGWRLNAGCANLSFNNNTSIGIGTPISTQSGFTTPVSLDYNVYSAGGGGNGFSWHDGSTGSFSNWKTACSCDSHSVGTSTLSQYSSAGAPLSGAPTIQWGINLGSIATGLLSPLQNDTTLGGTRATLARPSAGTCVTQGGSPCWDVGAYQFVNFSNCACASLEFTGSANLYGKVSLP